MNTPTPAQPSSFQRYRQPILIGAGTLLALAVIGYYVFYAAHHEGTDDAYTTGHVHAISTRIADTVTEVAVEDNQPVKKGDVLARLDPRDFQVAVNKAQSHFDRAQADFERATALKGNGAISHQEFDSVKSALGVAQAELEDAQNQLAYCTVTAPTDGVVGNKTVETGNRLAQGTVLMSVVEEVWIVANYKETQVGKMIPGQRVTIRVDAIHHHVFTGHIDSFSPGSGSTFALLPPENATGNFTKIVQRMPVKIVFDPESVKGYEKLLVPGLSVETDVDTARAPEVAQAGKSLPLAVVE